MTGKRSCGLSPRSSSRKQHASDLANRNDAPVQAVEVARATPQIPPPDKTGTGLGVRQIPLLPRPVRFRRGREGVLDPDEKAPRLARRHKSLGCRVVTWKIGMAPYPVVKPAVGRRYKVGPLCAMPTCRKPADHAHHIWSRSYMGRPCDWVEVEEQVHPNLLPLCWQHHEDVTGDVGGYRAGIRYEPESGLLYWSDGQQELELVWGASVPVVKSDAEFCGECGRRKPRQARTDGLPVGAKRPKT